MKGRAVRVHDLLIRHCFRGRKRYNPSLRTAPGDTIVEVMMAFAVFALVAVGAITIMNRGAAIADHSLEITLVREQIDSQANILRYAMETKSPAWQDIRSHLGSASEAVVTEYDECPDANQLPNAAFISSLSSAGVVEYRGGKRGYLGVYPGHYS